MGENIVTKVKKWIFEGEEEYVEEDEYVEEEYTEDELDNTITSVSNPKLSKIVNIHTANQMKVIISEPKKYDEVTTIADHLKQRRAVIVNLEGLEDPEVRKSIFNFMSGAVYVLDGNIQRVSKSIFILAPNNVDIDAHMKKELESKAFFPWQNK